MININDHDRKFCMQAPEESIEDIDPWEELREEKRLALHASSLQSDLKRTSEPEMIRCLKSIPLNARGCLSKADVQMGWSTRYRPGCQVACISTKPGGWLHNQKPSSALEEMILTCFGNKCMARYSEEFITFPFLLFSHLQSAKLVSGGWEDVPFLSLRVRLHVVCYSLHRLWSSKYL